MLGAWNISLLRSSRQLRQLAADWLFERRIFTGKIVTGTLTSAAIYYERGDAMFWNPFLTSFHSARITLRDNLGMDCDPFKALAMLFSQLTTVLRRFNYHATEVEIFIEARGTTELDTWYQVGPETLKSEGITDLVLEIAKMSNITITDGTVRAYTGPAWTTRVWTFAFHMFPALAKIYKDQRSRLKALSVAIT
jgi:hypothetical protein